jgi:GNAT superfamily N-acetyltransferase
MRVELTDDPAAYRKVVTGLLAADPVANTVLLTVVALRAAGRVSDGPRATYLSVHDDDVVVGSALRTPPWLIQLGPMPPAAVDPVAEVFARDNSDAAGVEGEPGLVRAFAARWRELTGRDAELGQGLRLHRLGDLSVPGASGAARPANTDDRPLAVDWFDAFSLEAEHTAARDHAAASVDEKLAGGRLWVWEDGGRPVCVVGHTEPQCGVARIGPVYTPPDRRGHGYAGALTGHVSRRLRDAGSEVCLFTDAGNPTANKIYAGIGYEPIADLVRYRFA